MYYGEGGRKGEVFGLPLCILAATAASASASFLVGEGGCDCKAAASRCFNKLNVNRFCSFKQFFVDEECQTVFIKDLVVFFWLIQSQPQ